MFYLAQYSSHKQGLYNISMFHNKIKWREKIFKNENVLYFQKVLQSIIVIVFLYTTIQKFGVDKKCFYSVKMH